MTNQATPPRKSTVLLDEDKLLSELNTSCARIDAGRAFHKKNITAAKFRAVLRDLGVSAIEIEMEVAFNCPENKEWVDFGNRTPSASELASPEESRAELEAWQKHRERQRGRPEPNHRSNASEARESTDPEN